MDDRVRELDDRRVLAPPKLLQQRVDGFRGHRSDIAVPDLEQRGTVACVQAFDFMDREETVGRRLAQFHAQAVLQVVHDPISPAHVAREARADLDHVSARPMGRVVHRVKSGHALDFGEAPSEAMGDFCDSFGRQPAAVLPLSDPQAWQETTLEVRVVAL